jgi:uncharacterized Zn finger protein (UPF0148 family)
MAGDGPAWDHCPLCKVPLKKGACPVCGVRMPGAR